MRLEEFLKNAISKTMEKTPKIRTKIDLTQQAESAFKIGDNVEVYHQPMSELGFTRTNHIEKDQRLVIFSKDFSARWILPLIGHHEIRVIVYIDEDNKIKSLIAISFLHTI